MADGSYKADSITVLKGIRNVRNSLNLRDLSNKIQKTGDYTKLSMMLNIDYNTLNRAIKETRILEIFPDIHKSKNYPLSILKIEREMKLFASKYDIKNIEVREIYKKIKRWKEMLEVNPRILLTEMQHDLIIGSTLGDANIRQRNKNCNFRITHSTRQKEYLLWKYYILHEFTKSDPYYFNKEIKNHHLKTLEFATITHSVFNYYRNLFYKNDKKIVNNKILNFLNPRSLAIWLCDDGSYNTKQGYIILCTNSFSLEEHKIMKKYFEEVWNINPTIGFRDNKYYYLRFKQNDTKKLINIIKPFVPKCMKYKIGEKNEF